ncbi:Epsin-1, required for endocytosis and actin patch assembly [Phytophthora pseudosyringae]|uniref:Epsin-1, required for endocytosis and actin patch assembly n=1 Tax=Phytophthora pseudosyringae TaxID=221518 RepID=A0A8T1VMK0_9STRA|nr:Epsin-1, required for endocytosis and actin patch assembly [Phytophthora pseudosyringae]
MDFLRGIIVVAFLSIVPLATRCAAYVGVAEDYIKFDGNVELYSGAYYDHRLLHVNIHMPNRCYNVNCTNIDNKTASAKWSGLPTTGWAGKAFITFYADTDCKGSKTSTLLPHNGGVREFAFPKVKGSITSFMVRSESKIRRHGSANVCSWTGADIQGGTVTEPDNGEAATLKDENDW